MIAGRLWICAWLALGAAAMGCGPSDDGGDELSSPDAAAACAPGCTGEGVRTCEPAERLTPCALGCNDETLACLEMVPSNGASSVQLAGVSAGLVIPDRGEEAERAIIDTDTGEIVVYGSAVRGAGEEVVDGMGFFALADTGIAVLAVAGLAVAEDGYLSVRGARPLVILSAGDVEIRGVVDVSAFVCPGEQRARCGGPGGGDGARDTEEVAGGCAPGGNGGGERPQEDIDVDETGGGGGGFGQDGAPGGVSGDGLAYPGAGGNVSTSGCPRRTLVPLQGGSGGGAGGIEGFGGVGGGGGGGLQITSFTRIAVLGAATDPARGIVAGGGGGGPGRNSTGGGGGGAGGAILLEAPEVVVQGAVLAANGGGGGGGGVGAGVTGGEDGGLGAEQARGGVGDFNGGLGGAARGPASFGGGGGDATGGGGGGAGVIRIHVPEGGLRIEDAVISPEHERGLLRLR